MVLAAVHHLGEDVFAVRTPTDVGDIPLGGKIFHLQPGGASGGEIIDPHGHFLGVHAVHGVLDELELSGAVPDVQKGEFRHLGLVFPVESHFGAIRAHEPAGIDAEFVAADGFSVNDILAVGGGNDKALFADIVPGEEASAFLKEGKALLRGLFLRPTLDHAAIVIKLEKRRAGVAGASVDGFFHGEVPSGMRGARVKDALLSIRKSAGEKGACYDGEMFHKLELKEKGFFRFGEGTVFGRVRCHHVHDGFLIAAPGEDTLVFFVMHGDPRTGHLGELPGHFLV